MSNTKQNMIGPRSDASVSTGFAFWDMMLQMQKASQQALSSFVPLAPQGAQAPGARFDERATSQPAQRSTNSVEIIPVGEETLHVGTRTVQGETTRLRRVVVETPVEQQVSLRTETVIVERRKPVSSIPTGDILSEKSFEMSDSFEVVESWKSVHLREEVVLRTDVVEHTETVRDTVRRTEVKVEQAAPRGQIEGPKHDKAPGVQAVEQRIAANIEAARPAPEVRMQDAVPPAAVKAEADRPAAPRPAHEANAQNRPPAPPQPDNKSTPGAVVPAEIDKAGAPPRVENGQPGQPDKGPASSGRRV